MNAKEFYDLAVKELPRRLSSVSITESYSTLGMSLHYSVWVSGVGGHSMGATPTEAIKMAKAYMDEADDYKAWKAERSKGGVK